MTELGREGGRGGGERREGGREGGNLLPSQPLHHGTLSHVGQHSRIVHAPLKIHHKWFRLDKGRVKTNGVQISQGLDYRSAD